MKMAIYLIVISMMITTLAMATEEPEVNSALLTSDNWTNYTFDNLGYEAKTFSGDSEQKVNMTFYSPSKYPKSILYPHLLVLKEGRVTININNASLFYETLEEGEYFGNITIPTGLIQEGPNSLSFIFSSSGYNSVWDYWYSYKITLLGDSAIGIETNGGKRNE